MYRNSSRRLPVVIAQQAAEVVSASDRAGPVVGEVARDDQTVFEPLVDALQVVVLDIGFQYTTEGRLPC